MTCLHTRTLDKPYGAPLCCYATCFCINCSCFHDNKNIVWCLMQRKPNQFQLPHDLPKYLGLATISDWEDYHNLELSLSAYRADTGARNVAPFGPPNLSAVHATFTEALMLQLQLPGVPNCKNRMRNRLIQGLEGPLEFAGLYAGVAAKYAHYCSLGEPAFLLQHFATQDWSPVSLEFPTAFHPSSKNMSEALDFADRAFRVMQQRPSLLAQGASG